MKRCSHELWISAPPMLWLGLFFILPSLIVGAFAFRSADAYGSVGSEWTLSTISSVLNADTFSLLFRTLWIGIAATAICICVAVPVGYGISLASPSARPSLLLWTILPFWTSFIIRIFAWKSLLHPEGFIKQLLVTLHILDPYSSLLYRPAAVLAVMVYTFLPIAILPIYAAAERFDHRLLEAARDLGMTAFQSFIRVFLPGIRRSLGYAALLVLIPCLGMYVIPDLVGGPDSEILGNRIVQRVFIDRNIPQASALSLILFLVAALPVLGIRRTKV